MNPFKIALIVIMAVNALATIAMIGRKREPITPKDAVVVVLINSLLSLLVVLA